VRALRPRLPASLADAIDACLHPDPAARLVVSLVHEGRRRDARHGLATLCVGVGQGQAAIFSLAGAER